MALAGPAESGCKTRQTASGQVAILMNRAPPEPIPPPSFHFGATRASSLRAGPPRQPKSAKSSGASSRTARLKPKNTAGPWRLSGESRHLGVSSYVCAPCRDAAASAVAFPSSQRFDVTSRRANSGKMGRRGTPPSDIFTTAGVYAFLGRIGETPPG